MILIQLLDLLLSFVEEKLATQAFNARMKSEKIFNHWVNVSTGFKGNSRKPKQQII